MSRNLVVFGAGDIADLAYYYFTNDTDYEVKAFTVDGAYIESGTFNGAPVIAFEEVELAFPPHDNDLFVALSYSKLNRIRKEKYMAAKAKGYTLPSYISSHATVLNQGRFGDNCFILEDNTIQPFVKVGNNVTMWSGNHIGHHSTIHDHVFIAAHVVVSGGCTVGHSSFIGVNATLRDHITVGDNCVIGAGVLLLGDTAPNGIYKGPSTPRSDLPALDLKKI